MQNFTIEIYDIKDIQKPILLKEIVLKAEGKNDAIDKAHTRAEHLYPTIKRMIHVR